MLFNKLVDAIYALIDELRKGRHAMTTASDRAKASADALVASVEGLIAATTKAVADLKNANSANDPAFTVIADELDGENAKAQALLNPPPPPAA